MSVQTLAIQLNDFQQEVRSLITELAAEIRIEQVKQQMKLGEVLGKIDLGHIAIHRLQEDVNGGLGRMVGRLRREVDELKVKGLQNEGV
ncbi:hypothetical protein EKO04_008773 [Ascochyta lentis]|uniref:Uncharacterized protein n=1 Tax=Ascochyta lentis TaxID=205686 RepID=A0A8H7J088_9PLEO|nr:hypothetical protein EKO04_008773 [Ascochyta lentis]